MTQASFRKSGTRIRRFETVARIIACSNDFAVLEYEGYSQPPEIVSCTQLEAELGNTLHLEPSETPVSDLPRTLDLKTRLEIERREHYVLELRKQAGPRGVGGYEVRRKVIAKIAAKLKDPNPPKPSTLGKWAKRHREHSLGIAGMLVLNAHKPHTSRYEALKSIAIDIFDEEFLRPNLPTFQFAYDLFVGRVEKTLGSDTDVPCYATFVNWIKDICPITASEKRGGKKVTRKMMRNAIAKIRTVRPLQRVECDAIRLAIGLVDEEGRYLGMATVLFVLDSHTRCVLGYCLQIGKGEPASSVIHAYRHAMCPKPPGSFNANCENDWPMYGAFETVITDGGPGYVAMQTVSFLNTAGMSVSIAEAYAGWKKPFIERFNGTVRTCFAQTLESYCGHDLTAIQDQTIQQKATMTPDQFRAALERWIVDEYHQSPHSGIDYKTPHQKWLESFKDASWGPMLPANYDLLQLPQGNTRFATILGEDAHQGVVINNVTYNDPERKLKEIGLKLQRRGDATTVECLYSVTDISTITVRDPFTDQTFTAPCTLPEVLPGMSLAEFDAQRTKRYSKKGYGRVRAFANSEERQAANATTRAKQAMADPTRMRRADPAQMTDAVHTYQSELAAQRDTADQTSHQPDTTTGLSGLKLDNLRGHSKS